MGPVMEPTVHRRILVVLLRLAGGITATAFLAVFLPGDWMAAAHQWLGLGEFPSMSTPACPPSGLWLKGPL